MSPRLGRASRLALAGAALLAGTEALLFCASFTCAPVTFDVGPTTGAYTAGFSPSEERPPTSFRWTGSSAAIELPLVGHGGTGSLLVRSARFLDEPTRTHVVLAGDPAATFASPTGRFRVARVPVALPDGPLRLALLPEGAPGDLGIAVDWIRVEGGRFTLAPSLWEPRALVLGAFAVALLAGFGLAGALGAGAAVALAEGAFAALDPFGLAAVAAHLAVPALAFSSGAALLLRRRPAGRWVTLVFLAGDLLRGAALFYPSYFYSDVRNNVRYVLALRDGDGSLHERSHAAQVRFGVAYPRIVGGKKYAFPYSPVFFLPFTLLPSDASVVGEAMRQVVLAASAAEVLVVFLMAGLVFGEGSGLPAAVLAAVLPVHMSRLLLALWATLGGHLLDGLLALAALALAARPESLKRLAALGGAALASLLTYVASLFNVSLFLGFLAFLDRPLRRRVLALWALGVALTLGLLYSDFLLVFFREILPAALAAPGAEAGRFGALLAALGRIRIFYGYGFPAFGLAGFLLARRRASPASFRVLSAYALAFGALLALRALAGGLFRDLKEVEFVAPLMAVTAGASLEELARRGGAGRWAAALAGCGLVAFALASCWDTFTTWTALADL